MLGLALLPIAHPMPRAPRHSGVGRAISDGPRYRGLAPASARSVWKTWERTTVASHQCGPHPHYGVASVDVRFIPDCVAKVVLHWWPKIVRAADAIFV
jgi:hypothetical protein